MADFDIGVLVVHGIGDQRRASTLKEFDDALVGSVRRWYAPAPVDAVKQPSGVGTPEHAHVTIDQVDGEPLKALVASVPWT